MLKAQDLQGVAQEKGVGDIPDLKPLFSRFLPTHPLLEEQHGALPIAPVRALPWCSCSGKPRDFWGVLRTIFYTVAGQAN